MTTFTRTVKPFRVQDGPDATTPDFEVGTSGDLKLKVSTVVATGSVQGDAAALAYGINKVTGADATKGVLLPVAVAGTVIIVKNYDNAVLKVWPASGDSINALSADTAISLAARTAPIFVALDDTVWVTLPLLPS